MSSTSLPKCTPNLVSPTLLMFIIFPSTIPESWQPSSQNMKKLNFKDFNSHFHKSWILWRIITHYCTKFSQMKIWKNRLPEIKIFNCAFCNKVTWKTKTSLMNKSFAMTLDFMQTPLVGERWGIISCSDTTNPPSTCISSFHPHHGQICQSLNPIIIKILGQFAKKPVILRRSGAFLWGNSTNDKWGKRRRERFWTITQIGKVLEETQLPHFITPIKMLLSSTKDKIIILWTIKPPHWSRNYQNKEITKNLENLRGGWTTVVLYNQWPLYVHILDP